MKVVLRCIRCTDNEITERVLGTISVKNTSSKTLKDSILGFLITNNLNVLDARSQGHDGASNMSGYLAGLAAFVKIVKHFAIHVNCML